MRIEFTKATDVDIHAMPKTAWGRLQKRVTQLIPDFQKMEMVEVAAEAPGPIEKPVESLPLHGPLTHFFRVGAVVDLPYDMAADFITAGAAKIVMQPDHVEFVDPAKAKQVADSYIIKIEEGR